MITYAKEIITHFNCTKCEDNDLNWWSVSSLEKSKYDKITCPFCGDTVKKEDLEEVEDLSVD